MTATRKIDAIVIGGSAGGLEAIGKLLPALPGDCSIPVAVVLHIPPRRPSRLTEVLSMRAVLSVKEAEDKEPCAPGFVYVAPPDYHLLIERDRTFALSTDEPHNFSRPSIDVLFESAADAYGDRVAGVVLTGANADGAAGLAAIRRRGGIGIVQSPDTAMAREMPDAAIARAGADHILTLDHIAPLLLELAGATHAEDSR
jgi:two-component system, chemotaxis family, protein-glutamate methylesterase/glutaminase